MYPENDVDCESNCIVCGDPGDPLECGHYLC